MTRWAIFGAMLGAILAVFVWWRGGVLTTLPTSSLVLSTSTPALPPLTAEREALLKFEDENLAAKVRQIGTSTPSRKNIAPAPPPQEESAVKNENENKNTAAVKFPPAQTPPPAVAVTTSTPQGAKTAAASTTPATSTALSTTTASAATSTATGTPIMVPPSAATSAPPVYRVPTRQFLVDGKGFCAYVPHSSVVLAGYPLVVDATIQGSDIKSWTDDRVIFWVPDSVPPGTYRVTVRGVNRWGYCTASTSSPRTVTVQ